MTADYAERFGGRAPGADERQALHADLGRLEAVCARRDWHDRVAFSFLSYLSSNALR